MIHREPFPSTFEYMYWARQGTLPAPLDDLPRETGRNEPAADPTTRRPYGYRVTGPRTFEVCTDFDRESQGDPPWWSDSTWSHGRGRRCFPREVRDRDK